MKTIEQCLDIILQELVKNWDKPNNQRDDLKGEEILKQFELPDAMRKHEFFKRLVDRLVKDGYAELPETGKAWYSLDHYQEDTLITIEGYYFITKTNGGYEKKTIADENVEILASSRDKRLANGTVYLAVGTFLLVLVEALIHRHELLSLFGCH
jgi:hypothetical protein